MPVYRHASGLTPREHAMAGQPPESSWQPAGQDQTQARAAWPPPPPQPQQQPQHPAFTPQGGAPQGGAPQDGYGYPQQPAHAHLPGAQAGRAAQPRARGERGFVGSLFDSSFNSFVTPKIIKVLYVLFTIWTELVSLLIAIIGFRTGGFLAGIFVLVIVVPIYVALTLGVYRVILEAFMVVFRIYEETKKISERTQNQNQV